MNCYDNSLNERFQRPKVWKFNKRRGTHTKPIPGLTRFEFFRNTCKNMFVSLTDECKYFHS